MKKHEAGLQAALASHPFSPDEEGGIYAVLDESGNVVPITSDQSALALDGKGRHPGIARDFIGPWIIDTFFQDALFADDPTDFDWFETMIFHGDTDIHSVDVVEKLAHAVFYASTVSAALGNHARAVQLAQRLYEAS